MLHIIGQWILLITNRVTKFQKYLNPELKVLGGKFYGGKDFLHRKKILLGVIFLQVLNLFLQVTSCICVCNNFTDMRIVRGTPLEQIARN